MNLKKLTKTEGALFCSSLLLFLVSAAFLAHGFYTLPSQNELAPVLQDAVDRISVGIKVVVTDPEGNVKGSYCNGDDLIVNNFRAFLSTLLKNHNAGTLQGTMVDDLGTTRTLNYKWKSSDLGTYYCGFYSTVDNASGGVIGIGNGTTAAATSDFKLESQVGSYQAIGAPAASNGLVVFSASVVSPIDTEITEAGFFVYYNTNVYSNDVRVFMFFHDVFSAISVSSSDAVTVEYTITLLGSGFTNNFGLMLASVLQYTSMGGTPSTITLTDITNTSQTSYLGGAATSGSTYSTTYIFSAASPTPSAGAKLGTGNTAFAFSNYNLESVNSASIAASVPTYNSGTTTGNITATASVIIVGDVNITEAGYFMTARNTALGNYTWLCWRTVFDEIEYENGAISSVAFILSG